MSMGVYIKGMGLPGKCGHCRFANAFDCGVDGKFIPTHDTRRADCPLVPVPPHGRLIDADALREDWLENGENEYVYDTNAFLDSLDAAPTIIPAEEG